jgi:hypothetical protein
MLEKIPKILMHLFVSTFVLLSVSTVGSHENKTTHQDLPGSNQMTQQMSDFISTLTEAEPEQY